MKVSHRTGSHVASENAEDGELSLKDQKEPESGAQYCQLGRAATLDEKVGEMDVRDAAHHEPC